MSNADLVAMAASVAVYLCGPKIKIRIGRKDSTSTSQEGKLPDTTMPFEDMLARFERLGFNTKEVVALSGAHTLGSANGNAFKEHICYELERWQTPEGKVITAKPPTSGHFDYNLISYVLYQHHHSRVTQPLLLEQLREWGVHISSG